MTRLLIRLFVKDYQNTEDGKVREQYGKFAGGVGIFTNLLLFAIKLAAGLVFNSISVLADAVNNLNDSASSIITMVGFQMAAKPATATIPMGTQGSNTSAG